MVLLRSAVMDRKPSSARASCLHIQLPQPHLFHPFSPSSLAPSLSMAITLRGLTRLSQGRVRSSLPRLASLAARSASASVSRPHQQPLSPRISWSSQAVRGFCSSSCLRNANQGTGQTAEDDEERAEWVEKLKEAASIPRGEHATEKTAYHSR